MLLDHCAMGQYFDVCHKNCNFELPIFITYPGIMKRKIVSVQKENSLGKWKFLHMINCKNTRDVNVTQPLVEEDEGRLRRGLFSPKVSKEA